MRLASQFSSSQQRVQFKLFSLVREILTEFLKNNNNKYSR